MSEHIEANIPITITGTPDVVFPYVFVEDLNSNTIFNIRTSATAFFRYYRTDENGNKYDAPIELGRKVLYIDDVDEASSLLDGATIIGILMNGGGMKQVIEYALVTIAKSKGII